MSTTTQNEFHPMRGHVDDGVNVRMNNGDICTVRASMRGWELIRTDGSRHGEPTTNANIFTCIVLAYPSVL